MKIIRKHELIEEKDVEEYEKLIEHKLPVTYKEFILEYNGGKILPDLFKENKDIGILVLTRLHGLNTTKNGDNLEWIYDIYDGRIMRSFVPFGSDPGGNKFCIGLSGNFKDKIYFWDHNEEVDEEDFEENVLPENMYLLSNSLNEFFNSLKDEEETYKIVKSEIALQTGKYQAMLPENHPKQEELKNDPMAYNSFSEGNIFTYEGLKHYDISLISWVVIKD